MNRTTGMVLLMTALLSVGAVKATGKEPGQGGSVVQPLALAVLDSLPLPQGEVRGLAWLSPDVIAVLVHVPESPATSDSRRVLITLQNRRGVVSRRADFTGTLERGLGFDGEFLWSCGDDPAGGSLLYKIEPDTMKVEEVYPTRGHTPSGISFDGQFIWMTDRDSGRLDRFDIEEEAVTRSLLTPAFSPVGLAHVGGSAWVADKGTGRLYRLRGQRGRWTGTVGADSFAYRSQEVLLASDGQSLWFTPAGGASAYRVRVR